MVSENRPWSPESSDPDIGIGDSLSPEDDDSEESFMPGAIRTQNEIPKGNAAFNLAAKTYRNGKKENKENPFFTPQLLEVRLECKKIKK